MLQSDPDWRPSLHVGHREERRHTRRSHASMSPLTESSAAAGERPAVRPWKDMNSLPQSVLQRPTEDRMHEEPAAVRESLLSFRDFFRDSLRASLEACSRLRALPAPPPSTSEEDNVELSVEVPSLKEQHQASSTSSTSTSSSTSSSSCLNCVRLQRRIVELQEKLSQLTGEQEDTEAALTSNSNQSDEALQSADKVDKEDVWTEPLSPLSPAEWALPVGVQDLHWDSGDESSSSEVSRNVLARPVSCSKPRAPPRFQKIWLTKCPFLRYSPSLNQMWCHVCRRYAGKSHQNLSMIRGSSVFKFYNLSKHSCSSYHRQSMERYLRRRLAKKHQTGKSHHQNESVHNESMQTESVQTESVHNESVHNESMQTESVHSESVHNESMQTESVHSESVQAEFVQTESQQTESVQIESVQTESLQTESQQTESQSEVS